MKSRFTLLLTISTLLWHYQSAAQCSGGRYQSEVFANITKTTEVYSEPYNLSLDVYTPEGDTLSKRPLVILAFGGSFISGDKTSDPSIVSLCQALAHRGYVTVSIDYRKADNPLLMLDSTYALSVVIKAISDGKAAIRYFVKDAQTENKYKIDVNKIFVGGNSAGAVLYMHAGYIDDISECSMEMQDMLNANGGLEGNSGNEGYDYNLKGIVNLAGGLNRVEFVNAGNVSSFNVQGSTDNIVPYTCANAMQGAFVTLCGLGSLKPVYDQNNIDNVSHVFEGKGHCPWLEEPAIQDTVQSLLVGYLYDRVCDEAPTAINDLDNNPSINIYPNPAKGNVTINLSEPVYGIRVMNAIGQNIFNTHYENSQKEIQLNSSHWAAGLYSVEIFTKGNKYTRKLLVL